MALVSLKSRYKDTFAYVESGGVEVMGPFQPPAEFDKPAKGWISHVVQQDEVGFPDILAVRYYGKGSEALWWCICLANGIIDPDLDMVAGKTLTIPPRDLVAQYTARRVSVR